MDSDDFEYSDNELDDEKHANLVANVLNLSNKQNVKKPSRTEPTIKVSEFDLVKSSTGNKGSVHLTDLTKSLKKRVNHVEIGKQICNNEKKVKTLPTPLEKPQADRIRRAVAYENTRSQLDRWDAIVTSNRAAVTMTFPFKKNSNLEKQEKTANYRLKSDLERELEQFRPNIEVIHVETEEKFPLTMEEIMEKRKESAKLRAQQGYKESKARRQNKIKSKKYHRIQKRERVKQQLKDFELLQKTNPEAALLKLDEIEKARAEERISLRHKSTGQWAKNKLIRAKYDKDTRQVLAQQLAISRDLTQKTKIEDETDSENEEKTELPIMPVTNSNNPWLNNTIKPTQEVNHFVSGYRKYWEDKNKGLEAIQNKKIEENAMEANENSHVTTAVKIKSKSNSKKKLSSKSAEIKENVKPQGNNKKHTKRITIKTNPSLNDTAQGTSDWDVTIIDEGVVMDDECSDEMIKSDESNNISDDNDSNEGENGDLVIENEFYKLRSKVTNKLKAKYVKITNDLITKLNKTSKNVQTSSKKASNFELLSLPIKRKKAIIDEELLETQNSRSDKISNNEKNIGLKKFKAILDSDIKESKQSANIDPNKFITIKPTQLKSGIPDLLGIDDNEENFDQREIISEAFENDDIVDNFNKEKQTDVDGDKPKDIDFNLPGWGSWGGKNIVISPRKRKRFILKLPSKMSRRDDNKGDLIINEKCNDTARSHLVSELPFPFTTVKDFEASVRAPIGATFVPETAFRKLTRPALTCKMGAIIDPMDEDVLLKQNKK